MMYEAILTQPISTLPEEPTDEDLAWSWTLSETDLREVAACRGEVNRLFLAVQLVTVRACGRFLAEGEQLPTRLFHWLLRQLEMEPVLFWELPSRDATRSELRRRVLEHLGFSTYDAGTHERLEQELHHEARSGARPSQLEKRAEHLLFRWRRLLPAPSTLQRLVGSVSEKARQGIFAEVAERIPEDVATKLDELVQAPPGERRSELAELLERPTAARADVIQTLLTRHSRIEVLGIDQINWNGIEPDLRARLAETARAMDAEDLRRTPKVRRQALMASLMTEARRSLLDQAVSLQDQFLTSLMGRIRKDHEERLRKARKQHRGTREVIGDILSVLVSDRLGLERSNPRSNFTCVWPEF